MSSVCFIREGNIDKDSVSNMVIRAREMKPKEPLYRNEINAALGKLRNELLELKQQDVNLYFQLKNIDHQIQRLKCEVRIEEENKAKLIEYDEEDENSELIEEDILYKHNDENIKTHLLTLNKESDITHARYDSGIQADEMDTMDNTFCSYGKICNDMSWRDNSCDHLILKEDKEQCSTVDNYPKNKKKYTTFVLTAPARTKTPQKINIEKIEPPESAYPEKQDAKLISELNKKSTQFIKSSLVHEENDCKRKEADCSFSNEVVSYEETKEGKHGSTVNGNLSTSPFTAQGDSIKRGSHRRQNSTKAISLVNISEHGELKLHDQSSGKVTSTSFHKGLNEHQVHSVISPINKRQSNSSEVSTNKEKSYKTSEIQPVRITARQRSLSLQSNINTVRLSDKRLQMQFDSFEKTSSSFAPVPGTRNTLPLSRTDEDMDYKQKTVRSPRKMANNIGTNANLRRAYSLRARSSVSIYNVNNDIGYYRTPSGENLEEHTRAYFTAARSVPRSVSVASLV